MKLGMQVGLGPCHIALDGDPVPPPPKGHSHPIFCPYLLRPMTGWIKMPLGREIGLGPDHIVLGRDPASPPQSGTFPQFSPRICCGQMTGWIKMPLCREYTPRLRPHCARWEPSSYSPKMGHSPPPQFSAHMSIVANRLDGSRCHLIRR